MSLKSLKHYRRGDVIMTSKPLVYVVVDQMKSKLCDYCLALKSSLMSCDVCKQMFYCNKICQQNDWSYHCLECPIFANNPHMTFSTKIIIRLWLMITADETICDKEYDLPNGQSLNLNDMKVNGDLEDDIVGLVDDIDTDLSQDINIKDMAVIQFQDLVETITECQLEIDLAQLWKLFTRVWSNVLKIDVYESSIAYNAYGLYVEMSSLGHSCEPNACYVSYGTRLQVRAIKPIKPSEKITISYIDIANPQPIRQQLLKSYFISCDCLKCQIDSESKVNYEKFHKLNEELDKEIALNEDIDDDKYQSLVIAEKLVPLYESIYGDFYPELSLFLIKYLRIMLSNVSHTKTVVNQNFLSFVLRSVRITHGVDHKIYRKVAVVRNITLLELESNADKVLKELKQKPTSSLKKLIYGFFFPFIIVLIFYCNFDLFSKQI